EPNANIAPSTDGRRTKIRIMMPKACASARLCGVNIPVSRPAVASVVHATITYDAISIDFRPPLSPVLGLVAQLGHKCRSPGKQKSQVEHDGMPHLRQYATAGIDLCAAHITVCG